MTPESETGLTRASEPASVPAAETPAGSEPAPAAEMPTGAGPAPTGATEVPPSAAASVDAPDAPSVEGPPTPAPPTRERGQQLERILRWTGTKLIQPRPRTVVVGVLLILVGTLAVSNSFWTFPLILVGVLMIVVAWVGGRLEGRFAIEWGEAGAGIELTARLRAPSPVRLQITPGASSPAITASATPSRPVGGTAQDPAPAAVETVEGEAHTMELDARELRALVAAIEAQAAALEDSGRVSPDTPAPSRNGRVDGDGPPVP